MIHDRQMLVQVLKAHQGSSNFAKAARQFLLKWSFYSSMVIRDLTLRSAASFGSFHLIRLLYDEYMFFLIEHKVAQSLGETPIGVMGNNGALGDGAAAAMVAEGAMSTNLIDLPATTASDEAASLPRSGATLDALLIDHEMLTKPSFGISSSSHLGAPTVESIVPASKIAAVTSANKLNSIPTSTTINNNINASLITAVSVNNMVELQTGFGPGGGVIQSSTTVNNPRDVEIPNAPASEVVQAVVDGESTSASVTLTSGKQQQQQQQKTECDDDTQQVLTSGASSQSSSSSSTTSLVSSSSIISLNAAPVGVIKQAGSGAGSAAIVASATIVGGVPTTVAGQTYVVVQGSESQVKSSAPTSAVTTMTASATKVTPTTYRVADTRRECEGDAGEPAAKRIKTE